MDKLGVLMEFDLREQLDKSTYVWDIGWMSLNRTEILKPCSFWLFNKLTFTISNVYPVDLLAILAELA